MSWLFSRALVEASSVGICSGGEPSAQSSGSPIPNAYLPSDRTKAYSRLSRFGMTFAPLTESLGRDVLTWCLEDSLAKTSASQERAPGSTDFALECGDTWFASLTRSDHLTYSWRTRQRSLLADSEPFSETWPRSGFMRHGRCYPLPMSERITAANESGLWPTPIANDAEKRGNFDPIRSWGLAEAVKLWPTPCATDHSDRQVSDTIHLCKLGLPKHIGKSGELSQMRLSQAVKMWATPVRRDFRHPGRSRMERTGSKAGECLPQQVGGALNPTWVEWLMGWPLGWTDLRLSATDKSPNAQPLPSENSRRISAVEMFESTLAPEAR